jgi:hypothetical protein
MAMIGWRYPMDAMVPGAKKSSVTVLLFRIEYTPPMIKPGESASHQLTTMATGDGCYFNPFDSEGMPRPPITVIACMLPSTFCGGHHHRSQLLEIKVCSLRSCGQLPRREFVSVFGRP